MVKIVIVFWLFRNFIHLSRYTVCPCFAKLSGSKNSPTCLTIARVFPTYRSESSVDMNYLDTTPTSSTNKVSKNLIKESKFKLDKNTSSIFHKDIFN